MGVEQLDIVIEMAVRTKEMNEPIDVASLNLDKGLTQEVNFHIVYAFPQSHICVST